MPTEERITYCRICEPLCGLVATVQDGELVKLRPDREHPLSRGFACPKGIAMTDVQNDPDRVVHPLRRRPDGEFERVSWDSALEDIGHRLRTILDRDGGSALGWYLGNPSAFSYSHVLWSKGFMDAIGSPHHYGAGSQDVNNRFVASKLLYGSPVVVPIPDIERTDLLLIVGANPLVSHGSVLTSPRLRESLQAIVERGGRVVVVDPRRSETARAFEHLPVKPDGDAWLLLSLLAVIFEERLEDDDALARQSRGVARLRDLARPYSPETVADQTGVDPAVARALARDLARSPRAAVYGRTGSCLGRHGTLVAFLLDALNAVTGNLDREGGAVFGGGPIEIERMLHRIGADSYGKYSSRIGGFPEVLGQLPAGVLAQEITTPGEGQIRALFVSSGNPVLSVPNGEELERAFDELELMVAIDLYVTDTSRHADYVLPATTFLEREDLPLAFFTFMSTPFVQWTEPVLAPRGEAKPEWEIIEEISRRIGTAPGSVWLQRALGQVGVRLSPRRLVDLALRTGPRGDLFGLRRGGLSIGALSRQPHGVVLADHQAVGVLRKKVFHSDRRVHLDPQEIVDEVMALGAEGTGNGSNGRAATYPLRLIGLRELRSHNSWMHNVEKLMQGGRVHAARVHPDDASAAGLTDGEPCRVASASGAIELPVKVTDEVMPGVVAVPHGWGHRGGWQRARSAGGANVNVLAASGPESLERLAGMAFLNGIPVRVEPVAPGDRENVTRTASQARGPTPAPL